MSLMLTGSADKFFRTSFKKLLCDVYVYLADVFLSLPCSTPFSMFEAMSRRLFLFLNYGISGRREISPCRYAGFFSIILFLRSRNEVHPLLTPPLYTVCSAYKVNCDLMNLHMNMKATRT